MTRSKPGWSTGSKRALGILSCTIRLLSMWDTATRMVGKETRPHLISTAASYKRATLSHNYPLPSWALAASYDYTQVLYLIYGAGLLIFNHKNAINVGVYWTMYRWSNIFHFENIIETNVHSKIRAVETAFLMSYKRFR